MKSKLNEYSIITDSGSEIVVVNAETTMNAIMNFNKFVRPNFPMWKNVIVKAVKLQRNYKYSF